MSAHLLLHCRLQSARNQQKVQGSKGMLQPLHQSQYIPLKPKHTSANAMIYDMYISCHR